MITKNEVLRAIVGLIEVGDYESIGERRILKELASSDDSELIRRIATAIHSLYDGYDYTESPEFMHSVEGKSSSFIDMKRRLTNDPAKRAAQRARLAAALIELPDTTRLLPLVSRQRSIEIDDLVRSVRALRNPD